MADCSRPSTSGKKTSDVWKHFVLIKESGREVAECNLCKIRLKYNKSTTALRSHLQYKHPSRTTIARETATQSRLNSDLKKSGQKPLSHERWTVITKKLVEWCFKDLRPLSIISGAGFRSLMREIEPSYKLPCHTTIRKHLKYFYEELKVQKILELHDVDYIALTTDTWTSCATKGYVTVTYHLIDSRWNYRYGVLCTREIKDHHTGEHLYDVLMDILKKFEIPPEKVCAVTTDNAANIVKGLRLSNFEHIRCFGHSLQLSVNAGLALNFVSKASAAARKLVGHFRMSTISSDGLKSKQEQLSAPIHRLIQDVSTRWNSTYYMLTRLLEQRLPVFAVLQDRNLTDPKDARILELPDDCWITMEEITPILKPLEMATTLAGSEEYPTLSMTYPIVRGLLDNHLKPRESDSKKIQEFKSKISKDLMKRYTDIGMELTEFAKSSIVMASALDNRYKRLRFLTEAQQEFAWSTLLEEMKSLDSNSASTKVDGGEMPQISGQHSSGSTEVDVVCDTPKCKKLKIEQSNKTMKYLLGDYYDADKSDEQSENCAEHELAIYREIKPIQHMEPRIWWRKNADRFPRLVPLAQKYLAILGTSVPAERIFSVAGIVVSKRRANLDPGTVDQIIFLRENTKEMKSVELKDILGTELNEV